MNVYNVWFESEEQKEKFVNYLTEDEIHMSDLVAYVKNLDVGRKYKMECPDDFLAGDFKHLFTKIDGVNLGFNPFIPEDLLDGFFNVEEI